MLLKEDSNKTEYYLKNILIGICSIIIYFFMSYNSFFIFSLFNINIENLDENLIIIYSILVKIFTIGLIALINSKSLSRDLDDITKNNKRIYSDNIKFWLISLGIMFISNFIILLISGNATSGNEESIRELFQVNPFFTYFSAVIYAPIIEELVFRRSIRNIIKNDFLFIFISGILFGSLHVIGNIEYWYDILYIIPYSAPGIAFAYMLTKTNNIFTSIGFHFMHNGILMALQLLIFLFS